MTGPRMLSAVLQLQPVAHCRVNGHCMRSMHGSFMANLDHLATGGHVDPALVSQLHAKGSGTQPFTASLLMQGSAVLPADTRLAPGDAVSWRLTGLTDTLCDAIERLCAQRVIEVDRHPFVVTGVAGATAGATAGDGAGSGAVDGAKDGDARTGWAGRSTYLDLFRDAGDRDRVVLSFVTATAFKAGDAFVPFPLPDSVFGGYLAMWQAFGNVDLGIDTAAFRQLCRERVWVDAFHVRTQAVVQDVARPSRDGRPHVFTGFVGSVSYRLDRLGERGVRALNVLADFSLFCGTGSKKAQGAGQTRRVR